VPINENRLLYRHRLWVRVTHWINVICMTIMLMTGLQIFNAHPALYWGNTSHFDNPLLVIRAFPAWIRLPGIEWLAMGRRCICFSPGSS
jgi:cytochrome b subunit of formate dehydrogenase